MRREDRVLILDMIDEAENVALFVAGRVRKDLDTDRMLSHALVRAIEVMGEAALSGGKLRASAAELSWSTSREPAPRGRAAGVPEISR